MAVLLLIIGLLFSACSFQQSDDPLYELAGVPVDNSCSEASQCRDGETCKDGICVTLKSQELEVMLEIAPVYGEVSRDDDSKNSTSEENAGLEAIEPVVAVVPPFIVKGLAEPRRFEVPLLVEVSGTIRFEGRRVPATITFIPHFIDVQANTIRTITATTTDEPRENSEGMESDFVTHVLQNISYYVVVKPNADTDFVSELPPFIKRDFRAVKSSFTQFDVEYTEIAIQPRFFTLNLPDLPTGLPLDVFAVSSNDPSIMVSSWRTIGDGILNFSGIWDFRLEFAPPIDFYDLIIAPVKKLIDRAGKANEAVFGESQMPIWPVFTIHGAYLETGSQFVTEPAADRDEASASPIEIKLPSVQQPINFSGYIDRCEVQSEGDSATGPSDLATAESNTNLPVAFYSTELFLNSQQSAIKSSYSTRTNAEYDADSGGLRFSVDLIPGRYEVVISPPSESPCEIFAKEITINSRNQAENRFALAPITYLEGTLKTANGEPVFGATIQAQALGRDGIDRSDNPTITRFNRSSHTTTDEYGGFRLPVDLGSYDIIAKPPETSRFGWKVIADVEIERRGEAYRCDIVLEAPVPIEGVLSYAETRNATKASELEGAEVRVFALIKEIGAGDYGKRNIAIGKATANEQGAFTALISPIIQHGL
ncbi:MAG: hypothetical protein JXA30_17770 [Deltaproteobacteria bacterium]|nr:hypothetical protein [Deltaproteobacteria bacterium]